MNQQAKHAYEVCNFYVKTMRHSCLLGNTLLMQAARKSPKYIILLHDISIRMLQHSKVHLNVEHSFMH